MNQHLDHIKGRRRIEAGGDLIAAQHGRPRPDHLSHRHPAPLPSRHAADVGVSHEGVLDVGKSQGRQDEVHERDVVAGVPLGGGDRQRPVPEGQQVLAESRVLAPARKGKGLFDRKPRRVLVELVNVGEGVLNVELSLVLNRTKGRAVVRMRRWFHNR